MSIFVVSNQNGTFAVGREDVGDYQNVPDLYSAICDARLIQQSHNVPIEIVVGPYKALLQ